jgi:RNA polymerase sigma-70 factor (ECF subfamily)
MHRLAPFCQENTRDHRDGASDDLRQAGAAGIIPVLATPHEALPTMPDDSFHDLAARLRNRDDDAAATVFHRFTHRLIALARLHLDSRVRQKVDPEDVLQSVYKSFFLRAAEGRFDLADWGDLWSLLVVITLRKCGRVRNRYRTASRDVSAELVEASGAEQGTVEEVLAAGPTPFDAVLLAELVERLQEGLAQRDRDIVSLALQGFSVSEIVQQTGTGQRTVYRVLDQVRAWLDEQNSEADRS